MAPRPSSPGWPSNFDLSISGPLKGPFFWFSFYCAVPCGLPFTGARCSKEVRYCSERCCQSTSCLFQACGRGLYKSFSCSDCHAEGLAKRLFLASCRFRHSNDQLLLRWFGIRTSFVRHLHHTYWATANDNARRYWVRANHQDVQRIAIVAQRVRDTPCS